jgi:hypothetical protein
VAKNARAMIAATSVAILSILVVLSGYPLVGAGVFVLGMIGLAAVRERDAEEVAGDDAQAKLDREIEDRSVPTADPGPAAAPASPPFSPSATLPPRPGALGLPTWQPSTRPLPEPDFGPGADAPTAFAPEPQPRPAQPPAAAHPSTGSTWDAWQDVDRGRTAPQWDDHNPLAELDRLDEIDPVAEVERLDRLGPATAPAATATAPSAAFSFSSAPAPINEADVRTDDDIMAASQATELQVAEGTDSELARLLAKVQQRLAAYE